MNTARTLGIRAVAFDLLTALIDSWSLWIEVADSDTAGTAWRRTSLGIVTSAGVYCDYAAIVAQAARATGLADSHAQRLIADWRKLQPWPEAADALADIRKLGLPMAIVTNCSQSLAELAARATGTAFDVIISAERAGFYKTDRRAYQAGLDALELGAEEVLFVAGSAHDVPGAGALGMPVYWSNRQALPVPENAPPPALNAPNLSALPAFISRHKR